MQQPVSKLVADSEGLINSPLCLWDCVLKMNLCLLHLSISLNIDLIVPQESKNLSLHLVSKLL